MGYSFPARPGEKAHEATEEYQGKALRRFSSEPWVLCPHRPCCANLVASHKDHASS